MANLQKYGDDLKKLIAQSELLLFSLASECGVDIVVDNGVKKEKIPKEKLKEYFKQEKSIDFGNEYERWYSEALEVIRQILPSRYEDFKSLYKDEKRKSKDIDYLTYTMSDYMIGLRTTKGYEQTVVVDTKAAMPKFQQQVKILKSAERKFESSLFEIKQLLQADLFDSELDTARELSKNGYLRAAGAVAGVVLEKHLEQISISHNIKIKAKNPSISDYNDTLKEAQVIDVPTWRFIQHLGDLRNLCDHKKQREPKPEEIEDLISGVDKVSKTVF
jgi:hypothetical protein